MLRFIFLLSILIVVGASLGCISKREFGTSTEFIDHAASQEWYLLSGSGFVQLSGFLDVYYLPEEIGDTKLEKLLDSEFFGAFDITADGTRIVAESVNRTNPDDQAHFIIFDDALNPLYENPDLVYHQGYYPYRWSPDGKLVTFAQGSYLNLFDMATEQFGTIATNHQLVGGSAKALTSPTFSADSTKIVLQAEAHQIVIHDIDTGTQTPIGTGHMPVWSPDGRAIVYYEGIANERQAMLYTVATGETTKLFNTPYSHELIWSPDSQYLIFLRQYAATIYGDLLAYSFATDKIANTGLKVASLRHGKIFALPEAFKSQLLLRADNDTKNPNRNPR